MLNNKRIGAPSSSRGNPSEGIVPFSFGEQQAVDEVLMSGPNSSGNRRMRPPDIDDGSAGSKLPRPSKRSKRANDENSLGEQKLPADDSIEGGDSSSSLVDIVVKVGGRGQTGSESAGEVTAQLKQFESRALEKNQSTGGTPATQEMLFPGGVYGADSSQTQLIPGLSSTPSSLLLPPAQYQQAPAAPYQSYQAQMQPSLAYGPMEIGAQQQYLQGYLNGLQQANASSGSGDLCSSFPPGILPAIASFASSASGGVGNLSQLPFNAAATGAGSHSFMATAFQQPQLPTQASYPILGSILNPALTAPTHQGLAPQVGMAQFNQGIGLNKMVGFSPVDGFPLSLPQILGRPDDAPNLTNHQMLLRHQIEIFEAAEEDSTTHTRGRNKPVMRGQVGLRCKHCKHLPVLQRQKGSTYFPNSLMGIYQAAQNMNTVHMQCGLCTEMPEEVKRQFIYSMCNTRVHQSGAGRHYWARAAKKLGLVDTEKDGIRFIRNLPPGAEVIEAPPPS